MTDIREDSQGGSARDDIGRIGEGTVQARDGLGPFGRLGLFIRQIVAELRKVHRPTRVELVGYTVTLIVFVLVVMAYIAALDFGFGRLVLAIFGGGSQ